jgi:lysophospholipase L1-like esterase
MNCSLRVFLPVVLFLFSGIPATSQNRTTIQNPWEAEIRNFEHADSLQPPPQGAYLLVGSSSIRMWETLREDFPDHQVINRGYGGSELADAVHFAERIIFPYKPKMVIVYAGDNDIANGKKPEQIVSDFKELVLRIHERLPHARIAYISIKPSLARWNLVTQIRKTNTLIRKSTRRDTLLSFIDVFTPMLGKDGKPRKELFLQDGLHMNRDGYTLWRDMVKPYLK